MLHKAKIFSFPLLLSLLLALPTQDAHAQIEFDIGPTVGFELNAFEALSVGADARVHVEDLPVTINPTFNYYFIDSGMGGDFSVNAFSIGANALYDFELDGDLTPYAGAGLNYTQVSVSGGGEFGAFGFSGSNTGLNLLGGAVYDMDGFQPFFQGTFTLAGTGSLAIGGGLLFDI